MTEAFRISWDEGELVYMPRLNRIQDPVSGRIIRIARNKGHSRSLFFHDSSRHMAESFRPICLTLYLDRTCNLSCAYCYSRAHGNDREGSLDPDAVRAAARIVAKNCRMKRHAFILGFHGGNEPLLHPERIAACVSICEDAAKSQGVPLRIFGTTNGVIPQTTAEWAAGLFQGITVSWDGPPGIHDRYRLRSNGKPTSKDVERTIRTLTHSGKRPVEIRVRCTITKHSVEHTEEIIAFFHRKGIRAVELFPVYQNAGGTVPQDLMPEPEVFVTHFLKARQWAKDRGIFVGFAGTRFQDFHHRFCTIFQDNLTITPDGKLTACFLESSWEGGYHLYGEYDTESGRIDIDCEKLERLYSRMITCFHQCHACFNMAHCSKACPNLCPLHDSAQGPASISCTMEKWIGLANVLEASGCTVPADDVNRSAEFFSNVRIEPLTVPEIQS